MSESERASSARWTALLARCGATADEAAARAEGDRLLACWDEPHRAYHSRAHLAEVLGRIDELAAGEPAADVAAAELAAWFHDAVYDPRASGNEARSSALASDVLRRLGAADALVSEVERLVLLTSTHDPEPDDRTAALLCDADLAVLGAEPDRYAAYAEAIRREYAHLSHEEFRAGRSAVLSRLLARDPLYLTELGRRDERAARRNLADELRRLTADPPDPSRCRSDAAADRRP